MWERQQWRPRLGLAKDTQTDDEVARGWRYRQPLLVKSAVLFDDRSIRRVSGRLVRFTGCAVKRWWSTAGVKPARELVRSTR